MYVCIAEVYLSRISYNMVSSRREKWIDGGGGCIEEVKSIELGDELPTSLME